MDIFDLFIKIGAKDEASGTIQKLTQSVGNGLKTAAKIGGAAVVAASAAVASMTKQAVASYAEYEQLVGGIDKLFGEGSQQLQEYAAQAYQTSGMSANQYMQSVTGFSAALINSLGGDTVKAAEIADMAMRDISDNANTFGKYSAEELTNVYQALAKGSYQTLDNLNLGFGGTKEGMQGLIDKANELRKAQGLNADLSIDSYADIVQAIHEVQTEMNITGTTANEAASTISGSMGMLKAAWENLLTGLGDSDADLSGLFDNVIQAAETALNNIAPVVEKAVVGIGELIGKAAPLIADRLPALVEQLTPPLISAATSLVSALIVALPSIIGVLISQLPAVLSQLWDAIKELGSQLLDIFSDLFSSAGESIKNSSFGKAFEEVAEKVKTTWENVKEFFSNLWNSISEAVSPMIDSVVNAFQSGWNLIQTIWNLPEVQETWQSIVDAAKQAWDAIKTVWSIAEDFFITLWDIIQVAAQIVWTTIMNIATAAWSGIQAVWNAASGYFQMVWDTIAGIFDAVSAVLQGDFQGAYDAIKGIVDGWADYFQGVWDNIVAVFDTAKEVGKQIVDDILSGIKSAWDGLSSWVSNAWSKIKGLFTVSEGDVKLPSGGGGAGHAIGLDYVPYNNYAASLHRGEAVLTAREAEQWRRGGGGYASSQPIQVNVSAPVVLDGATVARQTYSFMLNLDDAHGVSLINA